MTDPVYIQQLTRALDANAEALRELRTDLRAERKSHGDDRREFDRLAGERHTEVLRVLGGLAENLNGLASWLRSEFASEDGPPPRSTGPHPKVDLPIDESGVALAEKPKAADPDVRDAIEVVEGVKAGGRLAARLGTWLKAHGIKLAAATSAGAALARYWDQILAALRGHP